MPARNCHVAVSRLLGRERRLYRAYTRYWLTWADTARYGDTFPAFKQWQGFTHLPYFQGFTDSCLTCLNNGSLSYPIDPDYHYYRTGHYPVLIKETPHV